MNDTPSSNEYNETLLYLPRITLSKRNVERPIFRNFEIANIKITNDELIDSFIFEFIFSFLKNYLNT